MKNEAKIGARVWIAVILLLLVLYIDAFLHLNYGLKSVFDEGFFFLFFKPEEVFTVFTKPLSLSGEVLKAFLPGVQEWDVLTLRRVSFGLKGLGIAMLILSSCYFVSKEREEKSLSALLSLVACIMLMGLFVLPSVVVNMNDELVFVEAIVLSFCLLAVSSKKDWGRCLWVGLVGLFSLFGMLCNAPGGFMLCLLSSLFLVLYNGYDKKKLFKTLLAQFAGLVLGVLVMHFAVISIGGVVDFVKAALMQTTSGGNASHHSLSQLVLRMLFDARDCVIILTLLCGISYLCGLVQRKIGKRWLTAIVGIVLFVVLYKWQAKPEIKFAGIVTWIVLMTCVVYGKKKENGGSWNDVVLVVFLFLLPFGLSFGSNLGILTKAATFILPWGVLIFVLSYVTRIQNRLFSNGILVFVFALVLFGHARGLARRNHSNTDVFSKEYPIARMQLNKDQFAFYNEVHGILSDYDYRSGQDTILGFCFNEMTIVAMDAVPYTNDQLPEEFALHPKNELVEPRFMILSEWDEEVLKPFFKSLAWKFPEGYDCYKLVNNPDPDSGYNKTQSTLYCRKKEQHFDKTIE